MKKTFLWGLSLLMLIGTSTAFAQNTTPEQKEEETNLRSQQVEFELPPEITEWADISLFGARGNVVLFTSTTLEEDTSYDDLLNHTTIDLNGHTLTVNGTLRNSGTIRINGGKLIVNGNFIQSGKIYMTDSDDRLVVGGDLTVNSTQSHNTDLSAGICRLGGDFRQIANNNSNDRYNFSTTDDFEMVLCGKSSQTVSFSSPSHSGFANLSVENDNIHFTTPARGFVLKQDIHNLSAPYGFINTLDLNGHTLEIDSNIINYGTISVNGGTLKIHGNYENYGLLTMTAEGSAVSIDGDYYSKTKSHWGCLTEGIMEVKGDFSITGGEGSEFASTGNHILRFCGDKTQSIYLDGTHYTAHFGIFQTRNKDVVCKTSIGGFKMNEDVTLSFLYGTGFLSNDDNILCNGYTLHIKSDLYNRNKIYLNGGTLIVDGNLINISELHMTNENDHVLIKGDFLCENDGSAYSEFGIYNAGTLEIQGDFRINEGNSRNFYAGGTHTVLFSGDTQQTIYFSSTESHFNNLKATNENLLLASNLGYFKPQSDLKFTSVPDTITFASTLDFNGYSVEITVPQLILPGTLTLSGGKLIVNGNLEEQAGLVMTKPEEYVFVKGNFTASRNSSYKGSTLTDGLIEIQGNFKQQYANYTYKPSGNHKTLFSGVNQTISTEHPGSTCFAYVAFENDVTFLNGVKSFTLYKDTDATIICDGINFNDKIDLNGCRLHIKGNIGVKQMDINGGTLIVDGNYTTLFDYTTYLPRLKMTNPADYVLINGNYTTYGNYSEGNLTAGILEITGNCTIDKSQGFVATGTHKTILSGAELQTVSIPGSSKFHILEITKSLEEGYSFTRMPCWDILIGGEWREGIYLDDALIKKENGIYKVFVNVVNHTDKQHTADLIYAIYSKNGLESVHTTSGQLFPVSESTEKILEVGEERPYFVKVFLWSDINALAPLTETEIAKII